MSREYFRAEYYRKRIESEEYNQSRQKLDLWIVMNDRGTIEEFIIKWTSRRIAMNLPSSSIYRLFTYRGGERKRAAL